MGQGTWISLSLAGCCGSAGLETKAVISGFDDVTAVRQTVEQGGGHFGIAKDGGPLAETEVGGYDDAGPLVEFAEQME